MEKNNPLLPFAFSTLAANEKFHLDTNPRERHIIDENAQSMYHTRKPKRTPMPVLAVMPSMKRKMGESFNEKDDVKKRDLSEIPAQLAEMTTTNIVLSNGIPSSPPVLPQMSEYDVSTSNYTIPDSPVDTHTEIDEFTTSPVRKNREFILRNSSEADFGIDQFNRFKTSSYIQCPSTDADMEEYSHNEHKARELILQAFEDVSPSVSLEGMGLTEIPEQIKDLENLVIFDPDRLTQILHQLYLTNNRLRSLSPALFKFTKLNVLSLRHNKINHIPGAIKHLKNLVDLNLSSNRLRYLPPQILELPHLATFRAGPNPFVNVPELAIKVEDNDTEDYGRGSSDRFLTHVTEPLILQKPGMVPSLKSLCLDAIAHYDVTYRETKLWKKHTPKVLHPLIAKAISTGNFEDHCNECDLCVIEPYAEVYEWWDILANSDVPVKREFCSGRCVQLYKRRNGRLYEQ